MDSRKHTFCLPANYDIFSSVELANSDQVLLAATSCGNGCAWDIERQTIISKFSACRSMCITIIIYIVMICSKV